MSNFRAVELILL